jgi:hypothetical protein
VTINVGPHYIISAYTFTNKYMFNIHIVRTSLVANCSAGGTCGDVGTSLCSSRSCVEDDGAAVSITQFGAGHCEL